MIKNFGRTILFIIMINTGFVFSQDKYNLQQFIEKAVKNNQNLKILYESIIGSEAKIDESKSLYYPQVNLSGAYTRLSLISEMTFMNYNIKFANPDNYSMKIGVSEQLFNWGRTARAVELGEIGADLARTGVSMTEFQIAYQVIPIFYGILMTKEAIKVLDDNIKLFEKKHSIINDRYKSGLSSSFDLSMIEVQISSLRGQKLDFQNTINKLMYTYNRISGGSSTFELESELEYSPGEIDKKDLLNQALSNRLEFQQLKYQENISRTQIELSKTGNKPTVILGFNYEIRNGFMPEMDKLKGNWNALLSVTYPIFDGYKTRSQVEQGESNLRSIENKKTDMEQAVEMEIEQSISDINTIEQKIDLEKLKITQSSTALKIAEERFQSGLVSTTDLIEAQNNLQNAKLSKLQLIYNHILCKYNISRSMGKKIH